MFAYKAIGNLFHKTYDAEPHIYKLVETSMTSDYSRGEIPGVLMTSLSSGWNVLVYKVSREFIGRN